MIVKAARTADTLRVTLTAGQHLFAADAATEDGGTDTAPTPHELLAASLAACTSMTVQMYANRKHWPLTSCDVVVDLTETGDKKDPNSKTVFDVRVTFRGELDFVQRERLMDIASHCPVHRGLVRPIEIRLSENAPEIARD